jgi:NTP pyrophosphatase (non-canonical NTP hydrolase)
MINELAKQIHENAKAHGFFDKERNIGEMLCLIHSEVSEALEADRKNKYARTFDLRKLVYDGYTWDDSTLSFKTEFEMNIKNSFEDELADIMIRVMDLAAFKGIDLDFHIKHKMEYNSRREYKHGKKY